MSPLEIIGSALGFLTIALLVRRSIWNYPSALAQVTCIGFVLFEAKLYAEAGLQFFFFVVNLYGWVLWSRAKGKGESTVPVSWLGWPARIAWTVGTAIGSVMLGYTLHTWTDAALPFIDSAVTGMSISAQLLLSYRRVENWVLWLVVDAVSVGLYVVRDLPLLAVLTVVYGILSWIGLREWSRAAKEKRAL